MPITTNESGTLYVLDTVTANEGGMMYELDTVYSNEGGMRYEIHSSMPKKLVWNTDYNNVISQSSLFPFRVRIFVADGETYLIGRAYTDSFRIGKSCHIKVSYSHNGTNSQNNGLFAIHNEKTALTVVSFWTPASDTSLTFEYDLDPGEYSLSAAFGTTSLTQVAINVKITTI